MALPTHGLSRSQPAQCTAAPLNGISRHRLLLEPLKSPVQPNHSAMARISILTRGGVRESQCGLSNATCGTQCARTGSLSWVLKTSTSSRLISEYQCQRCEGSCCLLYTS